MCSNNNNKCENQTKKKVSEFRDTKKKERKKEGRKEGRREIRRKTDDDVSQSEIKIKIIIKSGRTIQHIMQQQQQQDHLCDLLRAAAAI